MLKKIINWIKPRRKPQPQYQYSISTNERTEVVPIETLSASQLLNCIQQYEDTLKNHPISIDAEYIELGDVWTINDIKLIRRCYFIKDKKQMECYLDELISI